MKFADSSRAPCDGSGPKSATLMAAAGAPLRTLQGWMGHRDYKTTEVYVGSSGGKG